MAAPGQEVGPDSSKGFGRDRCWASASCIRHRLGPLKLSVAFQPGSALGLVGVVDVRRRPWKARGAGGAWLQYSFLLGVQVIMQAFSREALQCYVPVITEEVGNCLEQWLSCGLAPPGLPPGEAPMFRIAMRILLGCESRVASGGEDEQQLVEAFEEMTRNLFSLPIDVPFSGLYRVRAPCGVRS